MADASLQRNSLEGEEVGVLALRVDCEPHVLGTSGEASFDHETGHIFGHGRGRVHRTQRRARRVRAIDAKSVLRAMHPSDRKSKRLKSSHVRITYGRFCLQKKKIQTLLLGRKSKSS